MKTLRSSYVLVLLLCVVVFLDGGSFFDDLRSSTARPAVLMVAGAAGMVLCFTPAWRMLRHMCTFLHELAHAVTAVVLGGRVDRITYRPDASGLATYALPVRFGSVRRLLSAGAGYLGPGIAGVVSAVVINNGLWRAWFIFCAGAAAVAMVLLVRSLWGIAYSIVMTGALWVVGLVEHDAAGSVVAAVVVGVMLAGGVRGAMIQQTATELTGSDADVIGRIVRIPSRFVSTVQTMIAIVLAGTGLAVLLVDSPAFWIG